ncbi:hypothetical protein [Paenibacillus beijingensis]|uniref:Glycosyltransferase RgtA/B/C/D-like domain-containing protein n=1 Tax=Paenibacillus beijingensis TaxID=1126833 RepID=A0A0D5NI20_9BACL|nr:hypothetical protein [Paenibacillus beijingensis]AJY74607.1 hypothetical protein VN24_08490 [Paenibacillus beijingensis]
MNLSFIKKGYVISLLFYLTVALIYLGDVAFHPLTKHIGGNGDPEQFMWYLGWFWHSILNGQSPFTTTYLNYPSGLNLMANTSLLAEGLLFGPLIYLTSTYFVYNLIFFLNLMISALLFESILRMLGIRKWLSIFGGVLVSMMPYTTAHLSGHINLTSTVVVFAIIHMIISAAVKGVKKPYLYSVLFGLLLAFQFYTSSEIFATAFLSFAIVFVLFLLFYRTALFQFLKLFSWKCYIILVVSFVILVSPGLYYLFFGPYFNISGQVYQLKNVYVNDLLNFILPTPVHELTGNTVNQVTAFFTGNFAESNGYLGIPLIILIIFFVQHQWNNQIIKILSVFFFIISILSMGSYLHILGLTSTKIVLPWMIFEHLPLIEHALPSRLMLYGDIAALLIILIGFEKVLKKKKRAKLYSAVPFVLLGIVAATWFPSVPFMSTSQPAILKDISAGTEIYNELKDRPTAIYTDHFPTVMHLLAETGYYFPTSDVYGFTKKDSALDAYRDSLNYFSNDPNKISAEFISSLIGRMKVEKILYIPIKTQMSNDFLNNLNSLLGKPIEGPNGAVLWNVPSDLANVSFEGDIYNIEKILGKGPDNRHWAGKQWSIRAKNKNISVTLTAPPASDMPNGVSINIQSDNSSDFKTIHLNPNETVEITIVNESIKFEAQEIFVPNNTSHNGDTRELSVMVNIN